MTKIQDLTKLLKVKDLIIFLIYIIIIGACMNWYAVSENNCKMPVKSLEYFYYDSHHQELTNDTKLQVLSDIFNLGFIIISIGDILIFIGIPVLAITLFYEQRLLRRYNGKY